MARCIIMLACILACMPAYSSPTDLNFKPIVITGQQAPGVSDDYTYSYSRVSLPAINAFGEIAFPADLSYASKFVRTSLWTTIDHTPSLAAIGHEQAPGVPSPGKFMLFDYPNFSDSGDVAFWAQTNSVNGYWNGSAGELSAIAYEGGPAPVSDPRATFGSLGNSATPYLRSSPALNSSGEIATWATLVLGKDATSTQHGVFSTSGDSFHAVARSGDLAPGSPANAKFTKFGHDGAYRPTLNDQGYVAFRAETSAKWKEGIWREDANGLTPVAQTNDPIPGTASDTSFSEFSSPRLNNAGQTVFNARLKGAAVSSENDSGVYSGEPGSLTTIAREGSQAPGLADGTNFADFADVADVPVINHEGRTAFRSALTGTNVDATNDTALFAEFTNGLDLVAREGDQAVGAPEGVVFDDFEAVDMSCSWITMNASGYVVFGATLRGDGLDDTNNTAIYACTPEGDMFAILRAGDLLEIEPGDTRLIQRVYCWVGSGGEDGYESGINDAGQVALLADFTDGSSGIFMTQIPEPTTACFLCLGGLVALRRRRHA